MIVPIVLAGGHSTRMGSPKALLLDQEGRCFIARIARTFAKAGFDQLAIVTGASHNLIVQALESDAPPINIHFARNWQPEEGQLSSMLVGMDAVITPTVEAILLTLVDIPFITVETIQAIIEAYHKNNSPIVRPAIGSRHGHPVLFDRSLFHALRKADPERGAKTVIRKYEKDILNVEISDEGALTDIDTPINYVEAMRQK